MHRSSQHSRPRPPPPRLQQTLRVSQPIVMLTWHSASAPLYFVMFLLLRCHVAGLLASTTVSLGVLWFLRCFRMQDLSDDRQCGRALQMCVTVSLLRCRPQAADRCRSGHPRAHQARADHRHCWAALRSRHACAGQALIGQVPRHLLIRSRHPSRGCQAGDDATLIIAQPIGYLISAERTFSEESRDV